MRIMRGRIWSHKFVSYYIIRKIFTLLQPHPLRARVRFRVLDRSCIDSSHFNLPSSTPQIIQLVMALLRYLKSTASLPIATETTLGDAVTQSANAAVLREVQLQAKQPRKRKAYTAFMIAFETWRRLSSYHGTFVLYAPARSQRYTVVGIMHL